MSEKDRERERVKIKNASVVEHTESPDVHSNKGNECEYVIVYREEFSGVQTRLQIF